MKTLTTLIFGGSFRLSGVETSVLFLLKLWLAGLFLASWIITPPTSLKRLFGSSILFMSFSA